MKLRLLLESFDPRHFLLHLQQLVVDEYPHADVELNHEHDVFTLVVKYFDLKPVTLSLFKRGRDEQWMIELQGSTTHSSLFDEHTMTPLNSLHAIETFLMGVFEACVIFEDSCQEYFTGDSEDEKWIYTEIGKLFKYLGTGRLKKAADVHIVVSKILDDEGLQKLETRYNSTLINSKKLRISSSSAFNPSDYRARLREVYILADLE